MVTMVILSYQGKNPHGTAGKRNRDLMISSQKRWPLDHEAGQLMEYTALRFMIWYKFKKSVVKDAKASKQTWKRYIEFSSVFLCLSYVLGRGDRVSYWREECNDFA
jgi:hypothetical protein